MASLIRIIDSNFFFDETTSIFASSSDTNFPVSNLTQVIRSKVWRSNKSNGTFVIDSTNNKIDFKESGGGGELTATLTSATYTATTLALQIKTQMEIVGAETYTISYSSITGKWTISHAGVFLSLLWATGTNTATNTGLSLGFTILDNTGTITYTGTKIAIHTEESVTIDIETIEDITSLAMVFDPFIGSKLSSSAVVKLQANPVNLFTSPVVDVTLTFDEQEEMFSHFFTTDQSFRYWRIKIIDPTNQNLQVELGKIILGKSISLTQNVEIGFKHKIKDQSRTQRTQFGHEYNDVYPTRKEFKFDFKILTLSDTTVLSESFERVGNTNIVMMILDPEEIQFDKDKFSIYGKYRGDFDAKHVFLTFFDSDLSIREVF